MRQFFSAQQIAGAILVGLILGLGGFFLTSGVSSPANGSSCSVVVSAGFDPRTGLPHGPTLSCTAGQATGEALGPSGQAGMQPDIALGRVPIGFIAGAGLALLLLPRVSNSRRHQVERTSGSGS
jgi:hypothetical protein